MNIFERIVQLALVAGPTVTREVIEIVKQLKTEYPELVAPPPVDSERFVNEKIDAEFEAKFGEILDEDTAKIDVK